MSIIIKLFLYTINFAAINATNSMSLMGMYQPKNPNSKKNKQ